QVPMLNNIGNEVWKSKEAGQPIEEAPALGDPERRAILMEAVSAVCYLLSGSNLVILRHPESVRLTRSFIDRMINGGMASDVKEISKRLPLGKADLISLSPEPNLDFGEEAPPKEKPAKPEKKPAAKPAKKEEKAAAPPKPVMEPEKEAKAVVAEAEAKKRAEDEARAKAEAEAKAKAKTKGKEDLQALRYQRALEREKAEAKRKAMEGAEVHKTAAAQQKTLVEKLIDNIDRIHRRL
ncbi:MAG: acetyl-CoA synthase, partial [Pseudomonadota bacterium]